MPKFVRSIVTLFSFSFRADRRRAITVLALDAVAPLSESMTALFLARITDHAIAGDVGEVTRAAVLLALVIYIGMLSNWNGFTLRTGLQERVGILVDRRLIELSSNAPGVEHHERPDYLDEMELLRTQRQALSMGFGALVMNLGLVVRMAAVVGLLGSVHPILMLLPLFGVPSMVIGVRTERMWQNAMEETAEGLRQCRHLLELSTTSGPGKELRIFGVQSAIVRRHQDLWDANDRVLNRALFRSTFFNSLGWLTFALGYFGAMALVVSRALSGQAGVGDVVLTFSLASQLNAQVAGAVALVSWLMQVLKTVSRYLWLQDYSDEARAAADGTAQPPAVLRHGIDFEGVAFAYPQTEEPVLAGVDLHIPAGSTVAIVGDNGAGKSTLIKLLCRFYEPTEGTIRIDGVDLHDLDVDAWRERLSAGFQDFAKLELIARETVGVGDLPNMADEEVVTGALQRASAESVVATLPGGLDAQVGRSFDGGAELSGGQWQKLALGRAMMRPSPLLLVLDEPTAALDAETEHALFERYAGAARRAAGENGAITLLVSHRFSTVRMADLILVIDGGRIVEAGSHAELTAKAGLYAELYDLQARAYR